MVLVNEEFVTWTSETTILHYPREVQRKCTDGL